MSSDAVFVSIQARGLVAIPMALRKKFGLDRPGAQVEIFERQGEIVMRPYVPIPVDQTWFWSERWQVLEHRADDDIAQGRVISISDLESQMLRTQDR